MTPAPARSLSPRRMALLLALAFLLIAAVLSAEGIRRYLDHGSVSGIAASQCEALRDRDHEAWDRCVAHYESRSRRETALDVLPGLAGAVVLGVGALVLTFLSPREEEQDPGA